MNKPTEPGLAFQFLAHPNLEDRVPIMRAAIEGRTLDELVTQYFTQLSFAVAQLRAAIEIAMSSGGLTAGQVSELIGPKLDKRMSEYVDYNFQTIIEGLEEPPPAGSKTEGS